MTTTIPSNSTQKITISLPYDLAERFKTYIPPRQRSTFIAKILEEYLALEEQLNALEENAGAWRDENHLSLRSSWQTPEA